jgi:hypothetical protein
MIVAMQIHSMAARRAGWLSGSGSDVAVHRSSVQGEGGNGVKTLNTLRWFRRTGERVLSDAEGFRA